MNHKIDIKSLAIGAMLAGMVALVVAAAAPGEKTVWEYKTVNGSLGAGVYTTTPPPRLDASINKEAEEGWEFVSVSGFGDASAFAVLKRPVKSK